MTLHTSNSKVSNTPLSKIAAKTVDSILFREPSLAKRTLSARVLALAAVFALMLGFAGQMQAQLSTATMFGTITDSSGAAVANATITLTQTDTNFTRVSTTKANGSYREEFLPIGPYKISVAAPGFKTLERSGISLSVMQNAELSLKLDIGAITETVQVTADVPLVNLGNATLGSTIDNVQIDNLPLVGRDTYRLLGLTPGVQSNNTTNSLGFPELHVYINGSTDDFTGQVSYYLDGGLNMTGLRNSGNIIPNPDAISQFNVQTNSFSAEYGRYAAAVVSVVTKSGTNKFHGSVFEFYRTKNFYATTHNQATKGDYNRHNFGATIGGPIRHNKDFFFGSYGGLIDTTSPQYTGTIPDAAQISGNFFENTPTAAEQASCNVAPTTAANAAFHFLVCNPATQTPYPNNTIPAGSLDPTAQNILKYLNLHPQPHRRGRRHEIHP